MLIAWLKASKERGQEDSLKEKQKKHREEHEGGEQGGRDGAVCCSADEATFGREAGDIGSTGPLRFTRDTNV